jgi:hypothetical protein
LRKAIGINLGQGERRRAGRALPSIARPRCQLRALQPVVAALLFKL